MRTHRTIALLAALSAVGTLMFVAGAGAATVRISISGSVTIGAVDPGTIDLSGVAADAVDGGNATGNVTVTYAAPPAGAPVSVFHGDVSQGCARVLGNRAIVVGHLPPEEQWDIPGFGHIEWVGGFLEDNGAPAGSTPIDRGLSILFRTTSGANACDPANTAIWTSVEDTLTTLDAGDASFTHTDGLDAFPANPDTDLSVVDLNGLVVAITDEPDPDGLRATVGAGSGFAKLSACGKQVKLDAGSAAVFTCASLITQVVTGSAEVVLVDGLSVVAIPAGGKAEIDDDGSGGFTVANLGPVPISVVVDGVEDTIEPGETDTVEAWDFQGFTKLADMPGLNEKRAGASVVLKWRVLDAAGAPVTDLSTASITVADLNCTTLEASGEAPGAVVGSGLQNLGGGYYQLNWKTLKSYAGTCKAMQLDIGDGVTHDAFFAFD